LLDNARIGPDQTLILVRVVQPAEQAFDDIQSRHTLVVGANAPSAKASPALKAAQTEFDSRCMVWRDT
jgi:hypothetical protein